MIRNPTLESSKSPITNLLLAALLCMAAAVSHRAAVNPPAGGQMALTLPLR